MVLAGYNLESVQSSAPYGSNVNTSRQYLSNLIIAAILLLLIVNFYITISDIGH